MWIVLILNLIFSAKAVASDETEWVDWLKAERSLIENRLKIQEKANKDLQEFGSSGPAGSSRREVTDSFDQHSRDYQLQLEKIDLLQKRLAEEFVRPDKLTNYFKSRKFSASTCDVSSCQKLLGLANRDLAKGIFSATNKLSMDANRKVQAGEYRNLLDKIDGLQDVNLELLKQDWFCAAALGSSKT